MSDLHRVLVATANHRDRLKEELTALRARHEKLRGLVNKLARTHNLTTAERDELNALLEDE